MSNKPYNFFKKKVTNPIFFFISIANVYHLRFLFHFILNALDFAIVFFIYMLIQTYRLPRDLLWALLFNPIWALVQYCCLLIYEITCDLSYLFSHFFYLLITSDVFDIELKSRRFLVTVMILYYLVYIRFWRFFMKFFFYVTKLSIIYYSCVIVQKFLQYLYIIFFQIIMNAQDILKIFIYLLIQVLLIFPASICHLLINIYSMFYNKKPVTFEQYVFRNINTLGFQTNDLPKLMKPIITNEYSNSISIDLKKKYTNITFIFFVIIYLPIVTLLHVISITFTYFIYYTSNVLIKFIIYFYLIMSINIHIPLIILTYYAFSLIGNILVFFKKKQRNNKHLILDPFNSIGNFLVYRSLKSSDIQVYNLNRKFEKILYQWIYYHKGTSAQFNKIYPSSNKTKKLKDLFYTQNHLYYRHVNNLLLSSEVLKPIGSYKYRDKFITPMLISFEHERMKMVSKYYNNFTINSLNQQEKLNFIWLIFCFFIKPYILFFCYSFLITCFTSLVKLQYKWTIIKQYREVIYKTYTYYKDIFFSDKKEVEPFIARFYYFMRRYIIYVFKILLAVSLFTVYPILCLFMSFIYMLQCLFYFTFSLSNRHFILQNVIYTLINSVETTLFLFLGGINKLTKISIPFYLVRKTTFDDLKSITNSILNWILIVCFFLLLGVTVVFLVHLGSTLLYLIKETFVSTLLIYWWSIKYMIYYIPQMEKIIPYIWYNLLSVLNLYFISYLDYIHFAYYRLYLSKILINNDLLILENYYLFPKINNKEGSILDILFNLTKHSKYNFARHSVKAWKVKYDLNLFYPKTLHSYYYYFLYTYYYQYFKLHTTFDNFNKGLAKPYYELVKLISYNLRTMILPRYGKKGIDVLTMIYTSLLVIVFYHKTYQYTIQAGFDQYPLNDVRMIAEDYIDPDLEFVNSEDHESIDTLESERANIYSLDSEWLPEYKMDYDMMIQGTESFDKTYIESELEFDAKFNQLLSSENEYDLFTKLYK